LRHPPIDIVSAPNPSLSEVGDRIREVGTASQLVGVLASERVDLPAEIRLALDDVSLPVVGYPERSV